MLNRMRSALAPKRTSDCTDTAYDPVAAAQAFFNEQIARMPTAWPSKPVNDNPITETAEVVEQDLRTVNYLQ